MLRRTQQIVLKDETDTPEDEAAPRPISERRGLGALRPDMANEAKPAPVVEQENLERWKSEPEPPPMSPEHRRNIERWRAEVLQSVASSEEDAGASSRWRHLFKPANIALLAVALIAGGGAAFLAMSQTPAPPAAEPAPVVAAAPQVVTEVIEEPTVQVLVAKRIITVGQRLSAATLEWSEWPEDAARDEFVTQAEAPDAFTDMTGAVARYEFFPGEPIREAKLARAEYGFLSAVLDPGTRAVAVQVAAETASGGFILPNDRVDVVLTTTVNGRQVSDTILNNVRVLAIGSRLGETAAAKGQGGERDSGQSDVPDEAEEGKDGKKGATTFASAIATLALDPRQSEMIIAATLSGRLSLVLRPTADVAEAATDDRQRAANEAIRISSPFWAN